MITYVQNDFNLPQIEAVNGVFNFIKTQVPYSVYGLTQKNNPPVLFTQNCNVQPRNDKLQVIIDWLKTQGIESDVEAPNYDDESVRIYIGLRKDVRENIEFSAALIRTIVTFFEDALELTPESKIPEFKIPKITLKKSSWVAPAPRDTNSFSNWSYYYN